MTRAQAAAVKAQLVATPDPEAFVRKLKADAAAKKVNDARVAADLDELADMFAQSVNVGKSADDALVDAFAKLGVGGRRKTRKSKRSKKARKTRKH